MYTISCIWSWRPLWSDDSFTSFEAYQTFHFKRCSICVYLCVYICMYVCVYIYIYVPCTVLCIYIYMCVCVCVCTVCLSLSLSLYIYIYIYIYVCFCVRWRIIVVPVLCWRYVSENRPADWNNVEQSIFPIRIN
jgi:hypothetical protein